MAELRTVGRAFGIILGLAGVLVGQPAALAASVAAWPQWGQNPQHTGQAVAAGQSLNRILADFVSDPFVPQEQAANDGDLLAHYQAPLVDGNDVYMEVESGTYSPTNWNTRTWSEAKLSWNNGSLVTAWSYASDWKPAPQQVAAWEPVFHAALAGTYVYVPGFAGTVWQLNKADGSVAARIVPFPDLDRNTFVAGPLTVDATGNILFNAIRFNPAHPDSQDIDGAWLVRIRAGTNAVTMVSYAALVPGAPTTCLGAFSASQLPWPPSPDAVPPSLSCGSQRPGLNVAPAVAPDGTIYSVSRAHFLSRYSYIVAINPDLTPKWATSLRGLVQDGCNDGTRPSVMPRNGTPGGCRDGAPAGVDPAQNTPPGMRVIDQSSSSPTVMPDGSVLYGAYTRYNFARGHLVKLSSTGTYLGSYDFGWDTTPAVTTTGAIVIKDNYYDVGSYCNSATFCPVAPEGPYYITKLSSTLGVSWRFQNTNTESCHRNADGTVSCVSDHPNGFEWCINAPAIDTNGVVYANSEDGNLYAINPDGSLKQRLFLNLAIGAAYTPLAIGSDGKIYTENDGHMFVVGN